MPWGMVELRPTNSMKVALGLRKGAWTDEEDALLRNCVDRHGEGKWHLVPSRAGLNRCRKSCRLRWLNYLKPNIKRGEFEEDEVDMIIRLHKLLGNRWSLIAGRIPGRTANHVKNYWNTRLEKNIISEKEKSKQKRQKAIKPHPRTFSRGSSWLSGKATLITCSALQLDNNNNLADKCVSFAPETEVAWWEGLSGDLDNFEQAHAFESLMEKETPVGELLDGTSKMVEEAHVEDWDDILFDMNLWQLLGNTPQSVV